MRIIGSIPRRTECHTNKENLAKLDEKELAEFNKKELIEFNKKEVAKFHNWLDGAPLNLLAQPTDTVPSKDWRKLDTFNGRILGCQYSSAYRDYHCEGQSAPRTDVFSQLSSEDSSNQCALEIFQIFMLALPKHIESLSDVGIFEDIKPFPEEMGGVRVLRHPVIEGMVDVVTTVAPKLFPDRGTARYLIVPAFLYHNLLPALKLPSFGMY